MVWSKIYQAVFARSSTTALAALGGGMFLVTSINEVGNAIWDWNNKGKQWKDVRAKLNRELEANSGEGEAAE